jgi:hypothetical protein
VRTSTAIDAATTPRPAEEIDPLRLNISGPSWCLDTMRRIAALIHASLDAAQILPQASTMIAKWRLRGCDGECRELERIAVAMVSV